MADFSAHVTQAKSNLDFLESLNTVSNKWDWKVTVSFYVAVHLVNGHIASKADMHFRSHKKIENVISPFSTIAVTRLPDDIFASYQILSNLSRRARYLCSEAGPEELEPALLTYDKHLKKALHHLNVLMKWFLQVYPDQSFVKKTVRCPELTKDLDYFTVYRLPAAV